MLYLLIVNATILITYSLYVILFRKLTFFQWNRVYLLSMLVVSLLIPVGLYIDLSQYQVISQQLPTIDLNYMAEISVLSVNDTVQPVRLMDVLIPIYWIGFGISLLWFCYRLYMLFYRSNAIGTRESFSFLGSMVLGEKVVHNKTIEAHESVHIQQGHTYDILFLEIVRCFNWFNPVLYFYRKELKFQHECIADEYCANNKVAYAEMLVAHALNIDDFKLSHGFSNHSFLKKRIMMLFKNKSTKKAKLFYLIVIPALVVMTASTLVFNTSKARNIVQTIENRIQDANLPVQEAAMAAVSKEEEMHQTTAHLEKKGNVRENPREHDVITEVKSRIKTDTVNENTIFTSVQVPPEYPGGMNAFRKFVEQNLRYPQAAIDAGVKGAVAATFVVERDGGLSDIKIVEDLGHGTGEALVELLMKSRKWRPGLQNGKPVRVQYKLPVSLDVVNLGEKNVGIIQGPNSTILTNIDRSDGVVPEFPDGMLALRKFIEQNFRYPQAAIDAGVKGTIEATFVVEKDGSLSDIQIIKDLGYDTGDAVIALLKKSPKWIPGQSKGEIARMQYKLPISLNLQ